MHPQRAFAWTCSTVLKPALRLNSEAALISASMANCHSSGWRVPWESKYAMPLVMVSEVSAWMALSTRPLAISALGPSRRGRANILKLFAAAEPAPPPAQSGGGGGGGGGG